jgi:hypothetical protein
MANMYLMYIHYLQYLAINKSRPDLSEPKSGLTQYHKVGVVCQYVSKDYYWGRG